MLQSGTLPDFCEVKFSTKLVENWQGLSGCASFQHFSPLNIPANWRKLANTCSASCLFGEPDLAVMTQMQTTKTRRNRRTKFPLCPVTLASIALLIPAMALEIGAVDMPEAVQALLLSIGFTGIIFGIGRRHRVDHRKIGETITIPR